MSAGLSRRTFQGHLGVAFGSFGVAFDYLGADFDYLGADFDGLSTICILIFISV